VELSCFIIYAAALYWPRVVNSNHNTHHAEGYEQEEKKLMILACSKSASINAIATSVSVL